MTRLVIASWAYSHPLSNQSKDAMEREIETDMYLPLDRFEAPTTVSVLKKARKLERITDYHWEFAFSNEVECDGIGLVLIMHRDFDPQTLKHEQVSLLLSLAQSSRKRSKDDTLKRVERSVRGMRGM